MSLYSNYKYVRPKTIKKSFAIFTFVIAVCLAAVVLFINFNFGKKNSVSTKAELPALEFHAVGTRGLSNKSKAMELAHEIRINGGAGFVDFDGEWFVIEKIGTDGDLVFSAESIEVTLSKIEHKELFNVLVQSFNKNTKTLQEVSQKSSREITVDALRLYNELADDITTFDKIQGTAKSIMYAEVLVAANKHLLALFMLSAEKDSENISSALQHCICSINFAYLELLTSLRASNS